MKESHDMLYKMASIGYFTTFKKNGKQESPKFKVFVCDDDFAIPHMHIWDDETDGKKIHTCVRLDKIGYFLHTGKEDILTPKQKKYLVAFLKEECKNKRYKTNWEYALSMWNDNNTDKTQVDETSEVLDYTKLNEQMDILQDRMMMRMGRVCSVGADLDILYFMDDDAPIPHFHVVDKQTLGEHFHTCIKIESPEYYHYTIEQYEYFHHNGQEGKLSDEQCTMLISALNQVVEHQFDKWSNWKYLLHAWNINNPNHKVDIHTPMPDYKKL